MSSPVEKAKNALRYVRRRARAMTGRDFHIPLDVHLPRERLGSEYGGWWLVPQHINANSIVYGVGVGDDITWDTAMIQRFGCAVHAFDPTPRCRKWLESQQTPQGFVFHPLGLSHRDGTATFAMQSDDPNWNAFTPTDNTAGANEVVSLEVRRVETLARELGHDHIDVLKMDIEGGEYDVIDDLLSGPLRPKQLLIEYHYWAEPEIYVPKTLKSVRDLQAAGYQLFARSLLGTDLCFILK